MTSGHLRYGVAACQTDLPNPIERRQMRANTDRMLSMIDSAVAGSAPFLPVRLLVFPEFAHAAPVFATVGELLEKLAVPIPNEHTDLIARKARELGVYVQSGSMIECDEKWPGVAFNTTCLIGPEGLLYKYRKVNPWIPYEVHASPHDLQGYDEPLFPVADTEIGRIGCAICYDWLFPEAIRQLAANGAEVLVRVSAYMDPWGATEPMNWWTIINRARDREHRLVVAANRAPACGITRHHRPVDRRSWISMGGCWPRPPGPGERIVVAPIDVSALRHERASRGHQMLAHLRSEAYRLPKHHFAVAACLTRRQSDSLPDVVAAQRTSWRDTPTRGSCTIVPVVISHDQRATGRSTPLSIAFTERPAAMQAHAVERVEFVADRNSATWRPPTTTMVWNRDEVSDLANNDKLHAAAYLSSRNPAGSATDAASTSGVSFSTR